METDLYFRIFKSGFNASANLNRFHKFDLISKINLFSVPDQLKFNPIYHSSQNI